MGKDSEAFQSQFGGKAYPAAFAEKYEIIECLGASDTSETLLVLERETCAYRVAKLVTGGVFDAEVGGLSHPGLPRLCDTIADGEEKILIRPFVEGSPLDKVLSERRLPEREIIDIGARLCDILSYLHTRRPPIIHRDVKPQNVILGADGAVTLIDFGIARTYKQSAEKDTAFSGTSDFAPPEQYGFSQTDARSDIYALGKLLQFLLTGGDMEGRIPSPRLRRVVRRCCAFSPASRYPSAQAVKRALGRAGGEHTGRAALALALAALICGFALGRYAFPYAPPKGVSLREPAVEMAARTMLQRPEGPLSADDLAGVTELYIVRDAAQGGAEDFFAALDAYQKGEGKEGGEGLATLEDLRLFPNLKKLCLAWGTYPNLDGLADCAALEHVELYNNGRLTDVSALKNAPLLGYVGLIACNRVADISALAGHELLTALDLTGSQPAFSLGPLEDMGDFEALALSGSEGAYRYVQGKRIGWLRVSRTGLPSMEPLQTVTGLWKLEAADTPLASLTGIEAHTGLQFLNIARTAVSDLTPLLHLPALTELVLSGDTRADVTVLSGVEGLTVRYE